MSMLRSNTKEELEQYLAQRDMQLYSRKRNSEQIRGVVFNRKRYTFKRLGLVEEWELLQERNERQLTKERELEQSQERELVNKVKY